MADQKPIETSGSSAPVARSARLNRRLILSLGLPLLTIVVGATALALYYLAPPAGTKVVAGLPWQAGPDAKITYERHATELPQQFPADFPLMPGLQLATTFHKIDGPLNTYTIAWTSEAGPDLVSRYYVKALNDKGWKPEDVMNSDNTETIFFDYPVNGAVAEGPRSSLDLDVDEETGLTTIDLTLNLPASQ